MIQFLSRHAVVSCDIDVKAAYPYLTLIILDVSGLGSDFGCHLLSFVYAAIIQPKGCVTACGASTFKGAHCWIICIFIFRFPDVLWSAISIPLSLSPLLGIGNPAIQDVASKSTAIDSSHVRIKLCDWALGAADTFDEVRMCPTAIFLGQNLHRPRRMSNDAESLHLHALRGCSAVIRLDD